MGETTGISWSHATLNFWVGCTKVSTGEHGACEFCYAETWALRWPAYRNTWGVGATRVRFKDTRAKALALERLAVASGAPFYCFSNSLSDIFDNEVPIAWLAEAFADMRAAPHVTFLLLTKRAPNILKRIEAAGGLPPNAALGITVVTQEEADRDVPHLLRAKDAVQPAFAFLSMEPLMGAVDLTELNISGDGTLDALNPMSPADHWREYWAPEITGTTLEEAIEGFEDWGFRYPPSEVKCSSIDWVITGGESGHKARPTHPDWLRSVRDQCAAAGVPYHHKQNGEWLATGDWYADHPVSLPIRAFAGGEWVEPVTAEHMADSVLHVARVGKKRSGRLLDGVLHDSMPMLGNV